MIEIEIQGTSQAVQWLRLRASTAGGTGSIPGEGTRILHAAQCGQKKKKKRNTYNKIMCHRFVYLSFFFTYTLSHEINVAFIRKPFKGCLLFHLLITARDLHCRIHPNGIQIKMQRSVHEKHQEFRRNIYSDMMLYLKGDRRIL